MNRCPVCLDTLSGNLVNLNCTSRGEFFSGHFCHNYCVIKLLQNNIHKCPICRSNITKDIISQYSYGSEDG